MYGSLRDDDGPQYVTLDNHFRMSETDDDDSEMQLAIVNSQIEYMEHEEKAQEMYSDTQQQPLTSSFIDEPYPNTPMRYNSDMDEIMQFAEPNERLMRTSTRDYDKFDCISAEMAQEEYEVHHFANIKSDDEEIDVSKLLEEEQKRRVRVEKQRLEQNSMTQDEVKQEQKGACPICLEEMVTVICLENCEHLICKECLYQYIIVDLKNIDKYPIRCFKPSCDALVSHKNVSFILRWKHKEKEKERERNRVEKEERRRKPPVVMYDPFGLEGNYSNDIWGFLDLEDVAEADPSISERKEEKEDYMSLLLMYEKFSVLCALPSNQRDSCPKCENVFFTCNEENEKQNLKDWVPDTMRDTCVSCHKKFTLSERKHHCRICGDIFCHTCSRLVLPLSNAIQSVQCQAISQLQQPWYYKWNTSKQPKSSYDSMVTSNLQQYRDMFERALVRSCLNCFVCHYRSACPECGYEYCSYCRSSVHTGSNDICQEFTVSAEHKRKDVKQLQQSRKFISNQNWSRCPGCKIIIAKSGGCNHMTHNRCPNPNDDNDTHFCYCCGTMLFGSSHQNEADGTAHFPKGVFKRCRKTHLFSRFFAKSVLNPSFDVGESQEQSSCVLL